MKSTQDLFDSIPKKVLLVGNGPLEEKGSIIDSFDFVIRFNKFLIDGYEEHVGTKVSAISFSIANLTYPHAAKLHETYSKYIERVPIFTTTMTTMTAPPYSPGILQPAKGTVLLGIHRYRDNPRIRLSSGGSLALNLSLLWDKEVYLIGFDFLKTGHYFDAAHVHSRSHSSNNEQRILESVDGITMLPSN